MSTNAAQVAQTILAQLGGNRFIAMTGAKNFTRAEDGRGRLAFKLPRKANDGINYVAVTLNQMDTYDVDFLSITGLKVREVSDFSNVYADQLRTIFEETTGLRTSL